LLAITVFSCAFHTFASRYPPSCQGINSPQLFTPTFGAHHFPSSKTTLTIPLRRMSEHLYLDEGPPQESTHNPSFHQSSTQNLHTIAEDPEHPTVEDIPEVQLLQLAHISTTVAGISQNSGTASSTQTGGGAPRQSPSWAPLPVHMAQGDTELNQVQIHDWDEEVEEDEAAAKEEELARVQQEIENLRQEQESIFRRQPTAQRAEA
jgi:hypothetical protein